VFPSELVGLLPLLVSQPDHPPGKKSENKTAQHSEDFYLTAQERKILECLVQGQTNKMIARSLHIAEATVKLHVKHLLRKTGLSNRTQLALSGVAKKIGR